MAVRQVESSADVVIIGAGASGMCAAIAAHDAGATTMLIEKASALGGTAAVSGGVVWAPANGHMSAAERTHDAAAALEYFLSLSPQLDREVLGAFVDGAGATIEYLERATPLRFAVLEGYPDYYLDRPGARPQGGRALDADLFDFRTLGEWSDRVFTGGSVFRLMLRETPLGGAATFPTPEEFQRRIDCDLRGFGQAVVGALLAGCLARRIEPRLNVGTRRLRIENDKVVGVDVEVAGVTEVVHARRAVILATGGFEWNEELVRTFLKGPLTHPASPPQARGDGLKLAQRAGAALGNMQNAWWTPTLTPTAETWPDGSPRSYPVLIERTLPGSIMVNRRGARFCNEATNYSALSGAFHQFDPLTYDFANLPCWLIFDSRYKSRYAVGPVPPGLAAAPDWIQSAASLEALALRIGCDAAGLRHSVERFNRSVDEGRDADFGRGDGNYDIFYGDRSRPGISGTLGRLDAPPYYAISITMGALGTNGGARTDARARVLNPDGEIIEGLFAAGNVMAAPTGSVYAGAGGTLGPALTFGCIAGRNAASQPAGTDLIGNNAWRVSLR